MTDQHEAERILKEGALPLSQLAVLVPPVRGRKRSPATLVRWAREGIRGVRLEAFHDGKRWYSSQQGLARFLASMARKEQQGRSAGATVRPEEAVEGWGEPEAVARMRW